MSKENGYEMNFAEEYRDDEELIIRYLKQMLFALKDEKGNLKIKVTVV